MSADEAAAIVTGIRGAVQDFLAPEIREMRADVQRLEVLRTVLREWRTAELRARQQPAA